MVDVRWASTGEADLSVRQSEEPRDREILVEGRPVDFLSTIDELIVPPVRIGGVLDSREPVKGHGDSATVFELKHECRRGEIER